MSSYSNMAAGMRTNELACSNSRSYGMKPRPIGHQLLRDIVGSRLSIRWSMTSIFDLPSSLSSSSMSVVDSSFARPSLRAIRRWDRCSLRNERECTRTGGPVQFGVRWLDACVAKIVVGDVLRWVEGHTPLLRVVQPLHRMRTRNCSRMATDAHSFRWCRYAQVCPRRELVDADQP